MTEYASNGATSTLAAPITAIATSLTIQAGDTAAFPSSGTFALHILDAVNGDEIVEVGTVSGTTFGSLTRASEAYQGVQTAFAHGAGCVVALEATAGTIGTLAATNDKGGQVFNVKAYGAKGNGSTDDTVAIQTAANAATAVNGTLFFSAGVYVVSGATTMIKLNGTCRVQVDAGATIRVSPTNGLFLTIFGAATGATDMTGTRFDGPGTIDCNSTVRAAGVPSSPTYTCQAIGGNFGVGSHIVVCGLRFTNFDAVQVVAMAGSALSDVTVSGCQFDTLGTTVSAGWHDSSQIYLDAMGMHVHDNEFWAGAT